MGYDLHITRAEHWPTTAGAEITLDEWRAYVASDHEFTQADAAGAEAAGQQTSSSEPGIAEWRAPSSGEVVWFCWSDGNIDVKNPDAEVIAKMFAVATSLFARVQGDDGEWYDDNGNVIGDSENDSAHNAVVATAAGKPWWKVW